MLKPKDDSEWTKLGSYSFSIVAEVALDVVVVVVVVDIIAVIDGFVVVVDVAAVVILVVFIVIIVIVVFVLDDAVYVVLLVVDCDLDDSKKYRGWFLGSKFCNRRRFRSSAQKQEQKRSNSVSQKATCCWHHLIKLLLTRSVT